MFQIAENGPNRLDLHVSGKLDADEMKRALGVLLAKAEGMRGGRMLYRIDDFEFPTFAAIGVELRQLPKLFSVIRNFERVALVADKGWMRKAGEIEGALFPGVEIRAFEPAQIAEAEQWLSC